MKIDMIFTHVTSWMTNEMKEIGIKNMNSVYDVRCGIFNVYSNMILILCLYIIKRIFMD